MDTVAKFFLKSLSVWGLLLGAVCSLIYNRTGVNISDQVGPLQQAVQGVLNETPRMVSAIGALVGVIANIVGRIRAKQPLRLTPPAISASLAKTSAIAVAILFSAVSLGLAGCGLHQSALAVPPVASVPGGSLPSASSITTDEAALSAIAAAMGQGTKPAAMPSFPTTGVSPVALPFIRQPLTNVP